MEKTFNKRTTTRITERSGFFRSLHLRTLIHMNAVLQEQSAFVEGM